MPTSSDDIQTVAFVSLGCPKNLVDSEKMLGLLAQDGLMPVPSDEPADAVVINTCGFLEASKDESLDEINQAIEAKKQGHVKRVVVAGCLVQRHRAKILEWCPDVDAMIGVFDRDRIVEAVKGPSASTGQDVAIELPVFSSIAANATLAKQHRQIESPGYFEDDSARLRLTPRHYAYLRISEGCNQNCAFCTIPSIRGKMRSKPIDTIVAEMHELMNDGAYEINLIGQDTTSFGQDIGYGPGLVGLLESVNAAAAQHQGGWIRLMYAYPSCFTDEMIDAIARLEHVLPYIDMPLQHINDQVLERMRRRTSRKLITDLLEKLRKRVPGMAIRTTFISGFPGETEDQHQELLDFIADFGFEHMGVFPYSPEPNTPAGSLYDDGEAIDDATIQRRIDALMTTQQQVAFARNDDLVAKSAQQAVLIDRKVDEGVYEGRTALQAPQVDSLTYVRAQQPLSPGEMVRCQVVAREDYDLIAQPVSELDGTVSLTVVR